MNDYFLPSLKVKLDRANAEAEGEVRARVQQHYSEVKMTAQGLHLPNFQGVANTLADVINLKEAKFIEEIARVFKITDAHLAASELEDMEALIASYFNEGMYLRRFGAFMEGVEREAGRYGSKFDPGRYRTAPTNTHALYSVSVKNATRGAFAAVIAELRLHSVRPGEVLTLKPDFHGISLDLKAIFTRVRQHWGTRKRQ